MGRKLIEIGNDSVDAERVVAVRVGQAEDPGTYLLGPKIGSRVIVDYDCGDHGACIVHYVGSDEEAAAFAIKIRDQVNEARSEAV